MNKGKERLKLFLTNFCSFGILKALEKVIPLIMMPIITRLLVDTADYGRYDMFNTIVELGTDIAVFGVFDAMFREFFEKDDMEYQILVTSVSLNAVRLFSFIVSAVLIIFCVPLSNLFLGDASSYGIVILAAVGVMLGARRLIVAAPTRMQNQLKRFIVINLAYSLLYYALALILVKSGLDYSGMIYSRIAVNAIMLCVFFLLNHKFFSLKKWDRKMFQSLVSVGFPLMITALIYWVYHSMDKVMITNMLGLKDVGIYSTGSKIASVSHIIYTAFSGGWQYFSFSTMKDEDQVQMTSNIFDLLAMISFIFFGLALLFDKLIFNILFVGDYVKGVEVFPYLFMCPLLLMLFQVGENQFIIAKKSKYSPICLLSGAGTNIVLNYVFISKYGFKGAGYATLIGYLLCLLMMIFISGKMSSLSVRRKFYIALGLNTILCSVIFFFEHVSLYAKILYFILVLVLYAQDIMKIIGRILPKK